MQIWDRSNTSLTSHLNEGTYPKTSAAMPKGSVLIVGETGRADPDVFSSSSGSTSSIHTADSLRGSTKKTLMVKNMLCANIGTMVA